MMPLQSITNDHDRIVRAHINDYGWLVISVMTFDADEWTTEQVRIDSEEWGRIVGALRATMFVPANEARAGGPRKEEA